MIGRASSRMPGADAGAGPRPAVLVAVAVLGGLALAWPMLATGGPFAFHDTPGYLRGGRTALQMAADHLGRLLPASPGAAGGGGAGGGAGAGAVEEGPHFIRSFVYSVGGYLAVALGGPGFLVFLQGLMTTAMLLALPEPADLRRPGLWLAGAVLVAATPVAFFASYLIPDIFSALIVLHVMLLVGRFDRMGRGARIVTTAIGCIAVAAHYGNPPMAMALYGAALAWLALRRRLGVWVLVCGLAPLAFSPVANLTASTVALKETSTAPLRMPILLARSIDDGPALWYLQAACPTEPLAFCEAFGGRLPTNLRELLFDPAGVRSLTEAQMTAIRAEEPLILWRAFKAYPLQQLDSFLGNSRRQFLRIGTEDLRPSAGLDAEMAPLPPATARGAALLAAYDPVFRLGAGLAALVLAGLALTGRLSGRERVMLGFLVLGLGVNAMVFGGLSAPADRYQTRVIWLVPALALLALARRRAP
ncbi:hypothetical protein [Frigidibacter sp. MR17.24]|uniref:hypothetical protein n=1 Tax=Frigidibacter sp. MR17.24 TaxID=3127345 RepID=UPI003012AFD1